MRRLAYFTMLSRSISTKFHELSVSADFDRDVVDGLIAAFTRERKPVFHLANDTLMPPGARLTTEIVESVLKGIRSWTYALDFFHWASTQNEYRHSCYTYNAMASILSNARQNAPLKGLILAILNSRCSVTPGALGFFIRCLARVGLVEEANMFFDQVKSMGLCVPDNYSYNCLLEAISKTNWVGLAETRLKEMRISGWKVDNYTLTPLLKVYCNAGDFQKALDVSNYMYEQGWFDVHLLSIFALSLSKWGKVDEAFELIERMEGRNVRLNEKTFYVLIHGFISGSRMDKALALFDKMRRSGFLPDVSIYDVLIAQLCKSKEFEKAFSLYCEMKGSGISPDVGILTKLIPSAPEEDMIMLFEDGKNYLNRKSLIFLYNIVLNSLVDGGAVDKAHHLIRITLRLDTDSSETKLEKLLVFKGDFWPNTASFHIVMDGLCRAGKLDEALHLFRDMDQVSCKKDLILYNNIIDAMSASNRLVESLELLREMKDAGFQPTQFTYNTIYGCFCGIGDQVGALNMVKEMRLYASEPWMKHTTSLIQYLFKRGKGVEACTFLSDMAKEGARPDIIPYSAALKGLLKLQEVDRSLELFQEVCADGKRPDVVAYNILINGLCKAERLQEAAKFLSEMLGNGLVPSVVTYNSVIDGCCKNGKIDQALVFFHKMAEVVDPNIVTYTTLIDGQCNAGLPDDAVMMWNEMQKEGCLPNRIAFMALINGLCKNGRPDAGLSYLHQMNEQELQADSYIYTTLLGAFLSKSNLVLAFNVLKEMVDKEVFPDATDKNFSVLKDAISRLSEDPATSTNMQSLLESGAIPFLYFKES